MRPFLQRVPWTCPFSRVGVTAAGPVVDQNPWSGVPAAVDAHDLPGEVTGLLGAEEGTGRGDVRGQADPADRGALDVVLDRTAEQVLGLGPAQHRGVDEAGRDRVDGDAGRA